MQQHLFLITEMPAMCTRSPKILNTNLLTDVGVITSACGITAYQGGAFPDSFNHNLAFVCEPVSNIVHADRLKDQGAYFCCKPGA
jgi:hypothetical protein